MDTEAALAAVRYGASVLCLDVPEGTEVGLDTQLWVVGPRFKGIKMIPPGCAHFFYYRWVTLADCPLLLLLLRVRCLFTHLAAVRRITAVWAEECLQDDVAGSCIWKAERWAHTEA